jgi:hypothetical protein
MVNSGSTDRIVAVRNAVYIPTMRNSPWAKFTIFITPKIMASPKATRAKSIPISNPDIVAGKNNSINTPFTDKF